MSQKQKRLPVSFTINEYVETKDSRFLAITIDVLHTGLNFNEIDNLSFEKYLLYNRDSWIDSFTHDETGLNFLKDLWRLQQTESDDSAIEEFKERRN